jgi:uncharacterized protein
MYFHIILTEECNSKCKYCYEKSLKEFDNGLNKKFKFDFSSPTKSEIKIKDLEKFLKKDSNPKVIFYGGEPLVNQKKLIEIMEGLKKLKNIRYFIQTNGKLLNELPKEYIIKFKKILISIDGNEKRTDFNRGKGTYEIVLKNIKLIKNYFNGEIIARMTISPSINYESYDIFNQIKHLFLKTNRSFNSIHWQLDMGFYKFDFDEKKISKFIDNYNKNITSLLEYWLKKMEKGIVIKLYPFLGIFESLYYNKPSKLRCGSGYANYTITTNGKLTCCPIMNNIKDFEVGDIKNSNPNNLKKIFVSEPCLSCKYLHICGGRCLYANKAKLWPPEGQELICKTIIHLIKEMEKALPKIKELIKKNIISEEQFFYEKYFGPEIIP